MLSSSVLFRRTSQAPAAVLLFLIENSRRMERMWEKLREDHLEPLLGMFEEANKDVPVQVITLEGTPAAGEGPRVYPSARESLQDIRFNPTEDNKLTVDKVERAAELLGSFKYRGKAVESHMIVVAATDPSPEAPPGIKQHPWFLVAKKIATHGPLCHISLVKDGEDISPFVSMFQNTLWLQECEEVQPPFHYDGTTFVFHFCSKTQGRGQADGSLPERATQEISLTRRLEKPQHHARTQAQEPDDTQSLKQYAGTSFRDVASFSFPPPSSSRRFGTGSSVTGRSLSRIDVARLADKSIQLPSVPELPNFGLSPYTVDPSASRIPPSSSNNPHRRQSPREPPPPERSSSFIDDFFTPNSRRDSHSDFEEDTEAFWVEGRAVEEALMRYEKDGSK